MGFYRTVSRLKRAARFFFYCKKIIDIFSSIICMSYQHNSFINIVSLNSAGNIAI